jgi:glycosyltransferase involved in cell wall biosynthesis
MDISVIVATRNRVESLRETLEALSKQVTGNKFTFEVLVADNGSTDTTAEFVKSFQSQFPVPLRYVYESQPGKAYALNAAIAQVESPLIAFTDDDCLMKEDWLALFVENFKNQNAEGLGGPSKPQIIGKCPAWLGERLIKQLGYIDYGAEPFFVKDMVRHVFIGTNHAYRRECFKRLGGFDIHRIGNSEDVEYFQRVFKAGGKLFYEPRAVVMHKLEAERWTPKAMAARFYRQGLATSLGVQEKGGYRNICRIPLWAVRYYVQLHFQALFCWITGKKEEALWHWFCRHIYRGMIEGTFSDWMHNRPRIRVKPKIS